MAPPKQPAVKAPVRWPQLGKVDSSVTAHAYQVIQDLHLLQDHIKTQKASNILCTTLNPFCHSLGIFMQRFLSETGVQAWESDFNEVITTQKEQAHQLENLTKAVQHATATATATTSPSSGSPGKARSWAEVAMGTGARTEPPSTASTVHTWTAADGQTYKEPVTKPEEREVAVKLQNSTLEGTTTATKAWIQGQMCENPRALIDHVNKAIQRASGEADTDAVMTDVGTEPTTTTTTLKPYKGIQAQSATFLKSGDVRFHTEYASQAKILQAHAVEWAKYIGNQAKVVVPTYGIVIHAIPTDQPISGFGCSKFHN